MRATLNNQWGHMRPAGRQFDMPGLDQQSKKIIFESLMITFKSCIVFEAAGVGSKIGSSLKP